MSQELAKPQIFIVLQNDMKIAIDSDHIAEITKVVEGEQRFIRLPNGEIINKNSVLGVFHAGTLSDWTRHRNGDWVCKAGEWHAKKEVCAHEDPAKSEWREAYKAEHGFYPLG